MRILNSRTSHHREGCMTALTLDQARRIARGLEDREQARHGGTRQEARARLAQRIGVMPGTLFNLARDRLKRLDDTIRTRLVAYAVRDLEAEIERLNHELAMARSLGMAPNAELVQAITTVLNRAQALHAEAHR
jgi:hypothetical protein